MKRRARPWRAGAARIRCARRGPSASTSRAPSSRSASGCSTTSSARCRPPDAAAMPAARSHEREVMKNPEASSSSCASCAAWRRTRHGRLRHRHLEPALPARLSFTRSRSTAPSSRTEHRRGRAGRHACDDPPDREPRHDQSRRRRREPAQLAILQSLGCRCAQDIFSAGRYRPISSWMRSDGRRHALLRGGGLGPRRCGHAVDSGGLRGRLRPCTGHRFTIGSRVIPTEHASHQECCGCCRDRTWRARLPLPALNAAHPAYAPAG